MHIAEYRSGAGGTQGRTIYCERISCRMLVAVDGPEPLFRILRRKLGDDALAVDGHPALDRDLGVTFLRNHRSSSFGTYTPTHRTALLSSTRVIQLFRLIPLSAAERATR